MAVKLCLVIPTWDNKLDVLECLRSASSSDTSGFTLMICVVDNGSSDGTPKVIKKNYPKIKLIRNDINKGFVEACNQGMWWALDQRYDYIALLNDDTIVDRSLVRNIFLEHQKYRYAGAISPKIYFEKGFEFRDKYKEVDLGKVIWYAGGKIDWKNVYGSNRGVDEVDKCQFDKTIETDFATGCFVMYKADALRSVGLYDEKFFAYVEDMDHAQRMRAKDWKVLYSPKGHLWHKVSQSSSIGGKLNDYFLTRNRMIFGMKYTPLRTKFALFRESIKLLLNGRKWQKIGIRDYYLARFGKGSWI